MGVRSVFDPDLAKELAIHDWITMYILYPFLGLLFLSVIAYGIWQHKNKSNPKYCCSRCGEPTISAMLSNKYRCGEQYICLTCESDIMREKEKLVGDVWKDRFKGWK